MIEISFKAFHDQDYRERGYKLYVLKNGNEDVLYVGISTRSIWERWFGMNGHILWTDRYATGESEVGQKVVDHLPDSLQWKIQLWTLKDCISFCKDMLPSKRSSPMIQFVEPLMIQKLSPALNVACNLHPGKDTTPISEREKLRKKLLDDAYDKVFNHQDN